MVLRRLLWLAAQRVASDPRARAKAREVVEEKLRPRAEKAWRQAKPRIEAARDELRDIARESDPREAPLGFARKVGARLRRRLRER